uniref:Acyl-coenzyme A oxidase n=1 Tax=Callorhinchus milii TaxID=7868 RepID=A0A4W3GYY7_CALMI
MSAPGHWSVPGHWSSGVNPDIHSERTSPSFPVERVTNLLDGGAELTATRRHVESIINSDSTFSQDDRYFLTRVEQYEGSVRRAVRLREKMKELGWADNGTEAMFAFRVLGADVAFGIHNGVFIPTIKELGIEAQIAKWVPLAQDLQIIGTYAQTELGHGTYLRGLETTVTFDPSNQEFVINMPRLSSIKWWPGDLGRSATHALVLAQLYTQGKCQGMHAFIVQIRSLVDHSSLPGVTVGDIGPKMNFDQVDNGFLILQNVHIPRENMLCRYSEVSPDGTYVKRGSDRINYFSMVLTRTRLLSAEIIPALAKACVIAIRYSVVRRQSKLKPGEMETKILDYQMQQQKLFPQLATVFAFHFMASSFEAFCNQVKVQIKSKGDFSSLPELHALSAGLKALLSDVCSAGVETCRRACGGHGYSLLSGLPSLYTRVAGSCTYEGENTVMQLQTARLIKNAGFQLQSLLQSGVEQYVAWDSTSILLAQAAIAHCQYTIVNNFVETMSRLQHEPEIQQVLQVLCDLYALSGILANAEEFLHDGYMTGHQLDLVTASQRDLLTCVRKDAVSLVDAFDYSDQQLHSAIGSYDGHAYQRLFEWAQKAPMNAKVPFALFLALSSCC